MQIVATIKILRLLSIRYHIPMAITQLILIKELPLAGEHTGKKIGSKIIYLFNVVNTITIPNIKLSNLIQS